MASHVSGIAITIKAFLPTGKTIDEQFETLSLMKEAHKTGDYSAVLKVAIIDKISSEQKTRRMEDATVSITESSGDIMKDLDAEGPADTSGLKAELDKVKPAGDVDEADEPADINSEDVPQFLRRGKKSQAAE